MKIIGINKTKSFISTADNVTHNGVEIHLCEPAIPPAEGLNTKIVTIWDMKPGFRDALMLKLDDEGFPINNDKGKCEGFYVTRVSAGNQAVESKK